MFTSILEVVSSIFTIIYNINILLDTKLTQCENETHNCDMKNAPALLKFSSLLDVINLEVDSANTMVCSINAILDNARNYLEDLINKVPHYDIITKYVIEDEDEDETEAKIGDELENGEYPPVYLDNLVINITSTELSNFTSDNGKVVLMCRRYIPFISEQLYSLLNILQNLETILQNDELIYYDDLKHHKLCLYTTQINAFTLYFTKYLDSLDI